MAYRMLELPMSGCCLNKTKETWATVIDFFWGGMAMKLSEKTL